MYATTNDKNTISKNYPKIITKYGNVEQQWRRPLREAMRKQI